MFDEGRRVDVQRLLLDRANADHRVVGAAITGSAADGRADRWSDVDLFFGVTDLDAVLSDFSDYVSSELGALHHFDLTAGAARYRAFLLPDLFEVDLGFAPAQEWGPIGDGGFTVVFGEPRARVPAVTDRDHLIGLGWHHIVHVRTALARGKLYEALHWVNALRDHTIVLSCLRHNLPTAYGKAAHLLPEDVAAGLRASIPGELTEAEIARALAAAIDVWALELRASDPELADRLMAALEPGSVRRS